jgi:hypothetical protein
VRRRFFTLASAISLLICLAAVGLWTGEQLHGRKFGWSYPGVPRPDGTRPEYIFDCVQGRPEVGRVRVLRPPPPPVSPAWAKSRPLFLWRHFGFTIMAGENVSFIDNSGVGRPSWVAYDAETYVISVPCWTIILISGALPAIWFRRRLRHLRILRAVGCCPSCGYNLTGNTSGVCPECGTAIPQKAEATA